MKLFIQLDLKFVQVLCFLGLFFDNVVNLLMDFLINRVYLRLKLGVQFFVSLLSFINGFLNLLNGFHEEVLLKLEESAKWRRSSGQSRYNFTIFIFLFLFEVKRIIKINTLKDDFGIHHFLNTKCYFLLIFFKQITMSGSLLIQCFSRLFPLRKHFVTHI